MENYNIATTNHSDIGEHINKDKVNSECKNHYRLLKEESENSRYNGFAKTVDFNADRKANYPMVRKSLEYVIKYVELNRKVDLQLASQL